MLTSNTATVTGITTDHNFFTDTSTFKNINLWENKSLFIRSQCDKRGVTLCLDGGFQNIHQEKSPDIPDCSAGSERMESDTSQVGRRKKKILLFFMGIA